MRIQALLLTLVLVASESWSSDSDSSRYGYFSAHAGSFIATRSGFSDTYGSVASLAIGGQVGLPLARQFRLVGDITYISNFGTPLRTVYSFVNGSGLIPVGQVRDGTVRLRQLLINAGTEVRFILSDQWTLFASGGLTFCRTVEMLNPTPPEVPGQTVSGSDSPLQEWVLGIFLGPTLEYRFADSPLALALGATYNVSGLDLLEITGQKLGFNSTLGVRYYFPFNDRRGR